MGSQPEQLVVRPLQLIIKAPALSDISENTENESIDKTEANHQTHHGFKVVRRSKTPTEDQDDEDYLDGQSTPSDLGLDDDHPIFSKEDQNEGSQSSTFSTQQLSEELLGSTQSLLEAKSFYPKDDSTVREEINETVEQTETKPAIQRTKTDELIANEVEKMVSKVKEFQDELDNTITSENNESVEQKKDDHVVTPVPSRIRRSPLPSTSAASKDVQPSTSKGITKNEASPANVEKGKRKQSSPFISDPVVQKNAETSNQNEIKNSNENVESNEPQNSTRRSGRKRNPSQKLREAKEHEMENETTKSVSEKGRRSTPRKSAQEKKSPVPDPNQEGKENANVKKSTRPKRLKLREIMPEDNEDAGDQGKKDTETEKVDHQEMPGTSRRRNSQRANQKPQNTAVEQEEIKAVKEPERKDTKSKRKSSSMEGENIQLATVAKQPKIEVVAPPLPKQSRTTKNQVKVEKLVEKEEPQVNLNESTSGTIKRPRATKATKNKVKEEKEEIPQPTPENKSSPEILAPKRGRGGRATTAASKRNEEENADTTLNLSQSSTGNRRARASKRSNVVKEEDVTLEQNVSTSKKVKVEPKTDKDQDEVSNEASAGVKSSRATRASRGKKVAEKEEPKIDLNESRSTGTVRKSRASKATKNQEQEQPLPQTEKTASSEILAPKRSGRTSIAASKKNEEEIADATLKQSQSSGAKRSRASNTNKDQKKESEKVSETSSTKPTQTEAKSSKRNSSRVSKTLPDVRKSEDISKPTPRVSSKSSSSSVSNLASTKRVSRSISTTSEESSGRGGKSKPIIMWSGYENPTEVKTVQDLGATITTDANQCTCLVTDKIRRTAKFLCALGRGIPIVSPNWISQSKMTKTFLGKQLRVTSYNA